MSELHEALKHLCPTDWHDVPQDNLPQYLADCFEAGELITNSVPPPAQGTPFDSSEPHFRHPNSAESFDDMHPSAARPQPPHQDHESLQKQWGKPMKFSKKDNPQDVHVYKMAGHDRHGAWFSRRSIHEGIGFNKFKKAMMHEFETSLAVEGGPGAGAIRGLAADRLVEDMDVKDAGRLEVFELSAAFPGPVTPRDFITLLLTSDRALTDKSSVHLEGGKKYIPRHFMIVSKPLEHPDAPHRSGFVRGQYESVELIREIPLSTAKSKSTPNLLSNATDHVTTRPRDHTLSFTESRGLDAKGEHIDLAPSGHGEIEVPVDDPELNPVEWIMITRSDPGGGIPRFLVERGTPDAMVQDIGKFFNWACKVDPADADVPPAATEHAAAADTINDTKDASTSGAQTESQPGIISHVTKAIGAGIEAYTPTAVIDTVHNHVNFGQNHASDDTSDTSSIDSFMSAEEMRRASTAQEYLPNQSTDNLSVASTDLAELGKDPKNLTHHDKEVLKLVQKREKLEQQLAKKRLAEESKLKQLHEKEETESNKQRERVEKELQKMEERHRKEVEKIERKKERESKKGEEKRRKRDEQSKISAVSRERDEFRSQADLFRRENALLREQVADLQAQNTIMATKLGKLGGDTALKSVQDEFGRRRSPSSKSAVSGLSADTSLHKKSSLEKSESLDNPEESEDRAS